jgi:membrane protease YdiL (CAAX protease family)
MRIGPQARPVLREVALVFVLSLLCCLAFIGLGQLVPFVRENLHAFVAVVFLLLPAWALGRRGEALEDYGLNGQGLGRALAVAGLLVLVTFPPYLVGHHYWQSWFLKSDLHFAWSNYSAFPDECQAPPRFEAPVSIWCETDEIRVQWKGEMTVEARGTGLTAGPPSAAVRVATATLPAAGALLSFEGRDGLAAIRVPPGAEAALTLRRDRTALRPEEIELGSDRRPSEQPVRLGRGWWWLLELLLAQIIAVALPEEVLYRGYVQGRLSVAFPRRRRILGADVSVPAVLWTSVLFALGHFLLDLNPLRLAVFFPSLAFGWIREHTRTLAGCIAFHALCNVLVRLLVVHY